MYDIVQDLVVHPFIHWQTFPGGTESRTGTTTTLFPLPVRHTVYIYIYQGGTTKSGAGGLKTCQYIWPQREKHHHHLWMVSHLI